MLQTAGARRRVRMRACPCKRRRKGCVYFEAREVLVQFGEMMLDDLVEEPAAAGSHRADAALGRIGEQGSLAAVWFPWQPHKRSRVK